MVEDVGFEPTERKRSTVFKTVALNQTLPTFLNMVVPGGFEPPCGIRDLQSPAFDRSATSPELY